MKSFDRKCVRNDFLSFLIEPKYRIYRHLLILLYIGVFFVLSKEDPISFNVYSNYKTLIWNGYFLGMFYFNMYVLIPAFLYKGKYFGYVISLIIVIVCAYMFVTKITQTYLDGYIIVHKKHEPTTFREILIAAHMLVLMVVASTSIKLFQRWARDNNRINELENNSLQLELRELKNQINPHFLFNMLNNVNVLVKKNPEKASLVILKLSDFLRYQLYDNNQQEVLLLSEIQFLNDFMDLENIRRDDFTYDLKIENKTNDKDKVSKLVLHPNLFIAFVENAIKHSIDLDNPSELMILFQIYENELLFICTNTKPEEPLAFSEKSGLGLANIKRRLELLYTNKFNLEIEDSEKLFKVTLKIPV